MWWREGRRLLHLALFGGVALHVENLCALDKILIYFPPFAVVVVRTLQWRRIQVIVPHKILRMYPALAMLLFFK